MRAQEFTKEQWDHGTTNNMMDTTPTESDRGNAYPTDSLYFFDVGRGGRSFTDQELEAMGLRKSLRGKWYFKPHKSHSTEQVNTILHRLSKETNVMPKRWSPPTEENDDGGGMGGFAFEQRAEQLRGKIAALETALQEKASVKLCRSPKRLGRSDHSSCVAQGLRPHSSKGKGHTDGNGHYLKGRKAKSVHYGGNVKDYS